VFIFANALIVLCGVTGLFARLMKIIPHSLAAAMLAGILLRFGLQAFAGLQDHLLLCGGMLAAWLLCKALWPRFAVVAALAAGALIAAVSGDVASAAVPLAFVAPEWIAPQFTPALLLSVGLPFFLVTMASQNAPGFATLQASGYVVPVSALIVACGGWRCCWRRLGSTPSVSRRSPPPFARARKRTRSAAALAGGHGCRRFLSAGRSVRRIDHRADVGPADGVDPDAGRPGAARHHRR
jgi:benzoate membrane transport protein